METIPTTFLPLSEFAIRYKTKVRATTHSSLRHVIIPGVIKELIPKVKQVPPSQELPLLELHGHNPLVSLPVSNISDARTFSRVVLRHGRFLKEGGDGHK